LQIYREALASPIAFISHKRKQVVIQFLNVGGEIQRLYCARLWCIKAMVNWK